jgi:hypothetical protein
MGGQITKSVVDGLKPRTSEFTVWDAKLPGFGVRVRPSGAKSYVIPCNEAGWYFVTDCLCGLEV